MRAKCEHKSSTHCNEIQYIQCMGFSDFFNSELFNWIIWFAMQLRWVLLHKIWQENFIRQCALYKELQSLVFGIAASRWWFTDLNDDLLTFKRLHSGDVNDIIKIIPFTSPEWSVANINENRHVWKRKLNRWKSCFSIKEYFKRCL